MQCLRETLDAREFETRLVALRNTRRHLDATDLAEIDAMRSRISEIDEIGRAITRTLGDNDIASCSASNVETALLAVERYAQERKEQYDNTTKNDGSIDAWGWDPDCDSEDSMSWRVTIRIVPASPKCMTTTAQQTVGKTWRELEAHNIDWEGCVPVVVREGNCFRVVEIVDCDLLPIDDHVPVFINTDGSIDIGEFDEGEGFCTPENDYDAWMPKDQADNLAELKARALSRQEDQT
jgi:hypothetical protein